MGPLDSKESRLAQESRVDATPSIVIVLPVLNERERLRETLSALAQLVPSPTVFVVDGGSEDGTPDVVQDSPRCTLVTSPRGRGLQLNAGISAVRAQRGVPTDAIVFLHVDCSLPQTSYDALSSALEEPELQGGAFRFAIADSDSKWARIYERGVAARCKWLSLPYGDQGFFVRREILERVGDFRPWPLFEDVEWYGRLRRAGNVRLLDAPLPSSARRFMRRGWLRSAVRNQALLALYKCGMPPGILARIYTAALFKLVFMCLAAAIPANAFACLVTGPFDARLESEATTVFEGKAVKLEKVSLRLEAQANGDAAKIVFEVTRTLRGETRRRWTVMYPSNTNDAPPLTLSDFKWRFGSITKVGVRQLPKQFQNSPVLVQGPCNPPYLFAVIPFTSVCVGRAEVKDDQLRKSVEMAARAQAGTIRECFMQDLSIGNVRKGVVSSFDIRSDGSVDEVKIPESTLVAGAVESCIKKAIGNWIFPSLVQRRRATVVLPLTFQCE